MNMLQPSENFTADQIRFLEYEATNWIQTVNSEIIKAASDGKSEATIKITESDYYNAPDALQEHFRQRGFDVIWGGQSQLKIGWKP